MSSPNELTYFEVTGYFYDVEAPILSGSTNAPNFSVVSAFVEFTPRLPPGTIEYIANLDLGGSLTANTALVIAPVQARILSGQLQVINQGDTPNVQLLANTAILGLGSLIYDVAFSSVVYASNAQTLANFAFTAPTTAGATIDLGDPTLTRLPYAPTSA